jgi:hypothetical protein
VTIPLVAASYDQRNVTARLLDFLGAGDERIVTAQTGLENLAGHVDQRVAGAAGLTDV